MYPTYQLWAVTCSVYRITEHYNSCGNPPYTTQETYEGSTTTYSSMYIGAQPVSGACR
ncbi:hypothetical protein [Corallococcus exercitus]|uniref:hypothetical protein n=1 Tax=Corallococcus exercitus TaxID=2316736 RepID=UPI0035D48C96